MRDLNCPVTALTRELISRPSVTPADEGCQALIASRLAALGFRVESLRYGEVDNLWAVHGSNGPMLCFAGHTDVVPPGPESAWDSPPFVPSERDEHLYGRGAADMKSGVAAMVVACERFLTARSEHDGRIGFLITSDEEGPALDGTSRVLETLVARGERIEHCLVGEATSDRVLGDTLRIGRRGSLTGTISVAGIQGHTAYPHLARNPVHLFAPALAELTAIEWDRGDARFPASSFQVSNIHAGTGANNVIPGNLTAVFNFRFAPALGVAAIQERLAAVLAAHGLDYSIEWRRPSLPYLTEPGPLTAAVCAAVRQHGGIEPELSTRGGTSDGRFFAELGAEVVELGPVNASIHKANECVRLADLNTLALMYEDVLERLFGN